MMRRARQSVAAAARSAQTSLDAGLVACRRLSRVPLELTSVVDLVGGSLQAYKVAVRTCRDISSQCLRPDAIRACIPSLGSQAPNSFVLKPPDKWRLSVSCTTDLVLYVAYMFQTEKTGPIFEDFF